MLKGKLIFAYTAGIIDGEGCIGIYRQKKKTKREFTYVLIVSLWNTNPWLAQWLKMNYGGSIVPRGKTWAESFPTWKQQWKWAITGNQAVEFLKLVLPYLNLKRPQAELAIAFQTKRREHLKTEDQTALLEAERILMSKMNKKGREEKSDQ